jgi:hypothetical protein
VEAAALAGSTVTRAAWTLTEFPSIEAGTAAGRLEE